MHWTSGIPLLAFLALASSQLVDKPPTIEKIQFKVGALTDELQVLKDPQDFVQSGSLSDVAQVVHRLVCTANNAATIKWQYKNLKNDDWSDILPDIIVTKPVETSGDNKILQIDDGETRLFNDLIKLNGFYRCVARIESMGYETQSPPVRLIIAYLQNPSELSDPVPGQPVVNDAFSIPCFKDISQQLVPEDAADFVDIKFRWERKFGPEKVSFPDGQYGAEESKRFSMNPKTGELYYAYLKTSDQLKIDDTWPGGSGTALLQCSAALGDQNSLLLSVYTTLTPIASQPPPVDSEVVFPSYYTDSENRKIVEEASRPVCTSNEECQVITVFAGANAVNGAVRGKDPNGNSVEPLVTTYQGFEFTTPESAEETQRYTAELYNPDVPSEVYDTLYVDIIIENYPRLADRNQFPISQDVVSGQPLEFVCEALHATKTEFYINGQEVKTGTPSYISWAGQNRFNVENVQRDNSFSVQCVSSNVAGSLYTNSILNVYDPPVLVQYPEPLKPYIVPEKSNETLFHFNCSITLDLKANQASIHWRSNRTGQADERITSSNDADKKNGIWSVTIEDYNPTTGHIASSLDLVLDAFTQHIISNTQWWCVVEYKILDTDILHTVESKGVLWSLAVEPIKIEQKAAWPYYPVVFGAVGGFLFLILLIILINCYVQKNKGEQYYAPEIPDPSPSFEELPIVIGSVAGFLFLLALIVLINCYMQKNKGEQYYVDAKERKAGHNPDEEMAAYGFSDYTRPDQDPVKGSRASMNMSDGKPMESDTGSLDEYGADMDPSRYNEDGSFIGEYSQNGQHSRNQADV